MVARLMLLCEDTHGALFFRKLMNRLKNENRFSNRLHTHADRFFGPCNPKLERQMKPMSSERGYNFFILVADGDNKSLGEKRNRIEIHIPEYLKTDSRILLFEYEIEEWLCFSLDVRFDDKPSKMLKHRFEYEKYRLSDYVEKLDFEKMANCQSFCEFAEYLKEIDPNSKVIT